MKRLYRYRAVDRQGVVHDGEEVASNPRNLRQRLAGEGLIAISWRNSGTLRGPLSLIEQIEFTFSLERLLRAGLSLLEAIGELASGHHPLRLRALACQLRRSVEGGETLSAALKGSRSGIDPLGLALVRVGEESGRLGEMLAAFHDDLRRRELGRAALRRALFQPLITLVAIVSVAGYMIAVVVPGLVELTTALGQQPPFETRALLWLSGVIHLVAPWLLLILPAIPLLLIASARRFPLVALLRDRVALTIWWFGSAIRRAEIIRFCRAGALLYQSGVPLLDGLPLATGVVSNRVIADALNRASEAMVNGATLSEGLASSGQLPPLMVRMVAMGERGGLLDEALRNVAQIEEDELNRSLQRFQSLLEPMLTLLLGFALAWVMVAVLGPVFEVIAGGAS